MKKTITLKKNYEFKKVLTKGKYFSGRYLDIYVLKNHSCNNYIGIAIGVKVAKAVKRNRIKRLIRENYRLIEERLKTGYTIILLWKRKIDIKNATYENINKDIIQVFKKIGILE